MSSADFIATPWIEILVSTYASKSAILKRTEGCQTSVKFKESQGKQKLCNRTTASSFYFASLSYFGSFKLETRNPQLSSTEILNWVSQARPMEPDLCCNFPSIATFMLLTHLRLTGLVCNMATDKLEYNSSPFWTFYLCRLITFNKCFPFINNVICSIKHPTGMNYSLFQCILTAIYVQICTWSKDEHRHMKCFKKRPVRKQQKSENKTSEIVFQMTKVSIFTCFQQKLFFLYMQWSCNVYLLLYKHEFFIYIGVLHKD